MVQINLYMRTIHFGENNIGQTKIYWIIYWNIDCDIGEIWEVMRYFSTQEPKHVLQLDLVHRHSRRLHWYGNGGAAVRAAHREGLHGHVQDWFRVRQVVSYFDDDHLFIKRWTCQVDHSAEQLAYLQPRWKLSHHDQEGSHQGLR